MKKFPPILDCIPQRPPFVMVDRLLDVSETLTKTSFKIAADNIFCDKGIFYEAGLIENIAQTAAAGDGFRQQSSRGNPKIGFIGAVKKLKVEKRPEVGEELVSSVRTISSFSNALIVEGTVDLKGIVIASCQMNIFIIDEPKPMQS